MARHNAPRAVIENHGRDEAEPAQTLGNPADVMLLRIPWGSLQLRERQILDPNTHLIPPRQKRYARIVKPMITTSIDQNTCQPVIRDLPYPVTCTRKNLASLR